VELVGWIGAEPEQHFLPSGTAVCNFRVATKRWAARNEDGSRSVGTDWTPVEAWDKLAETCALAAQGLARAHHWQPAPAILGRP
jgi:single-stranded DNA-binding protein